MLVANLQSLIVSLLIANSLISAKFSAKASENIPIKRTVDTPSERQIIERPIIERPIIERRIIERRIIERRIIERRIIERRKLLNAKFANVENFGMSN
jgi:hypothetical protein